MWWCCIWQSDLFLVFACFSSNVQTKFCIFVFFFQCFHTCMMSVFTFICSGSVLLSQHLVLFCCCILFYCILLYFIFIDVVGQCTPVVPNSSQLQTVLRHHTWSKETLAWLAQINFVSLYEEIRKIGGLYRQAMICTSGLLVLSAACCMACCAYMCCGCCVSDKCLM
jgi:hypothetical protein